jgi:tellurite resistance protein TehA-like permease
VSFMFLTLYLSRLLFYKFPPRESIFTSFIPIGFLGQGSFAILLCGHNFQSYFLRTASDESTVEAIVVFWICLLSALFLQSMGIVITSLAIASVLSYGTHKFHYGWWAMTFPLGTMSHAMTRTGVLTDWYTFKVVGAMYGTASIFMTLICICGSSYQVYQWVIIDSEYDIESEAETKLATISSNTHSVHV